MIWRGFSKMPPVTTPAGVSWMGKSAVLRENSAIRMDRASSIRVTSSASSEMYAGCRLPVSGLTSITRHWMSMRRSSLPTAARMASVVAATWICAATFDRAVIRALVRVSSSARAWFWAALCWMRAASSTRSVTSRQVKIISRAISSRSLTREPNTSSQI